MITMKEMADEYQKNILAMEERIRQLESQAARTSSLEIRRKLRKRINTLHVMICESRQTVFQLEHYYDKPKENPDHVTAKPAQKSRKKFSRHGYGAATPALAVAGRGVNKSPVSGIRAVLSRGNAAKGNCTRT